MSQAVIEDLEEAFADTAPMWEELRGQRLFIVGGTGFFGCWFLESVAWANTRFGLDLRATVLSRNPDRFRQNRPALASNPAFEFQQGDVRSFRFPPGQYSYIIHAGADTRAKPGDEAPFATPASQNQACRGPRACWGPLEMLDTMVQGTRHCLEFALDCGARKFLYLSAGAVYGLKTPQGVDESFGGGPDPLNPHAAYAEGKRVAELQCALAAASGIEVKIARCFTFLGPYMELNAHFAIGNFIRDQMKGGPIRVHGDGQAVRSYMYAGDLMVWLWTILLRGASGRAYNVGSEKAVTIGEVAQSVADALSPRVAVEIAGNPNRAGAAHCYVPSTARAKQELGLRCRTGLREAIQRTHAWFRHK